jgi:hypothetical protein
MAIRFALGAEEAHKIGEQGAYRIRRWLDSTFRFRIDRSIYDLDPDGNPYPMMRLPQLPRQNADSGEITTGQFERFDLRGMLLSAEGQPGRTLWVECKEYSSAGNQGTLYDEYLAVCYAGYVKMGQDVQAPPDMEFMWATTHPFAQNMFTNLTTAERIKSACETHVDRLGEHEFDMTIAQQLAPRLWLSIVNARVEEMMMGHRLRKAVLGTIDELTA